MKAAAAGRWLIYPTLCAFHLGCLLGMQAGELADDAVEPPVPPGLDELTGSLKSFEARQSSFLGTLGNDKANSEPMTGTA